MSSPPEKPPKFGTEITVRISLTFQEAPDVHTLLAMTPVRERGKLIRLALERYVLETGHPAGDVDQQIHAISKWLKSRYRQTPTAVGVVRDIDVDRTIDAENKPQFRNEPSLQYSRHNHLEAIDRSVLDDAQIESSSLTISRWLQT